MKRFTTALLLILLSSTFLFAEKVVVTLKDGTRIIGEQEAEDDSSITVRAPNQAGITDLRQISKDDIENTRPWGPHDRAFEPIKDMVPTDDLVPQNIYEERIDACKRFLEVHKDGAPPEQIEKVQEILKTLEEELARVKDGAVKFNGSWIGRSEREANEYEIDMQIGIARMREAVEAGNHRHAMKIFDVIQRDFTHSENWEEARQLALETLAAYKQAVTNMLRVADDKVAARQESLQTVPAAEREEEEAAIKRLDDAYQRRLEDEPANAKWLPLNAFHKKPMQDVLRNIDQTMKALEEPKEDDAKEVGPIFREVWKQIRQGDLKSAEEHFDELKPLNVPDRYLVKMEAQIEPPETEAEPEPEPETTTPDPSEEEKPEDDADEDDESKQDGQTGTESASQSGTKGAAAADEEEKGFPIQIVLVIVLVVVVVGALLAAFGGKKR